jgi:hypothetical protein
LEFRDRQTYDARELALSFHCVYTKASALKSVYNSDEYGLAFFARKYTRREFYHHRIGIHSGEGFCVFGP